ncbi:unnamed protein product, partial [marine sediment metagenome]
MSPTGRIAFRAFTCVNNGLSRTLKSRVDIAPAFDPSALTPGSTPPFKSFVAVWDTGATASVITQKVVDACNLKPTGMMRVYHADGEANAETYIVNIALPNKVAFRDMKVTKGNLRGIDALIGMDIINEGDLAITNAGGKTAFSFRMPSVARIDYVKEAKTTKP